MSENYAEFKDVARIQREFYRAFERLDLEGMRAVWHVLRELPATGGSGTFIGYARGRTVRVETDSTQPVELDGEAGGATPFTASVVPEAISVVVPA